MTFLVSAKQLRKWLVLSLVLAAAVGCSGLSEDQPTEKSLIRNSGNRDFSTG